MNAIDWIQTACTERVHSAIIAWIFSPDCREISSEAKASLITRLFVQDGKPVHRVDAVYTELHHMDIVFKCSRDVEGDTHVIVENKVKSGEHSEQLNRYERLAKEHFPESRSCLVYLTLIGESPNKHGWKPISYREIETGLREEIDNHRAGSPFISTYLETLSLLNESVASFLKSPSKFENVFTDGNKKKYEKDWRKFDEFQKYIAVCGLETILQRMYYREILKHLSPKAEGCRVTETHGNGLLDIKRPAAVPDIRIDSLEYDIGIQFQRNSVKLQVEKTKPQENLKQRLLDSLKQHQEPIHALVSKMFQSDDWQLNKGGKNSVYMSLSKPIGWEDRNRSYYDHDWQTALGTYEREYDHCIEVAQLIRRHFNKEQM